MHPERVKRDGTLARNPLRNVIVNGESVPLRLAPFVPLMLEGLEGFEPGTPAFDDAIEDAAAEYDLDAGEVWELYCSG